MSSLTTTRPVRPSTMPSAQELETIRDLADELFLSGLLTGVKNSSQAVFLILMGADLGVGPIVALESINIIQNKPACSAELMQALIYRDHGDAALIWLATSDTTATLSYRRRTWTERRTYTFTTADAKRARLQGDNWAKYPASMLRARCVSNVARMAFPDVISGLSIPDEIVNLDDAPVATGWEHGAMDTATETGFAPGGSGTGASWASGSDGAPPPADDTDPHQLSEHDRLIVRREGGSSQNGSRLDHGAPVPATVPPPAQAGPQSGSTGPEEATDSQRASIIKTAAKLGIATPDLDTFDREGAKALIQSLSQQFNARNPTARPAATV